MAGLTGVWLGAIGTDNLSRGHLQRPGNGPVFVDYATLKKHLRRRAEEGACAPPGHARNAVCLLMLDSGETEVVLIQKADHDDYHWRDQVALPGGRIEPADHNPQEAALRELHEELGIPPEDVEVIGCLGHFQTLTRRNDLEVFVVRWITQSALQVDRREVARVFEVSLRELVELHAQEGFRLRTQAEIGEALIYPLREAEIWGVTARILHGFLEACSAHLH